MPTVFIRNGGNKAWNVTLSAHDRGEHVLQPGEQAKVETVDDDHHTAVMRWISNYGVEHSETPFENCGEPIEIKPVKPKPAEG